MKSAILDADKEGFLRSETSLVQTIGRAARNEHGEVIMYADSVTPSMEKAITETVRRREIQEKYNAEHGIIPKTIKKDVHQIIEITSKEKLDGKKKHLSKKEEIIMKLKKNNVNVLLDEIRTITIKGNKINILGLVEEQGSAEAYMKRAKGNFQYKDYSIIFQEFAKLPGIKLVLCHYPENFKAIGDKSYYKYKFDLMFSGHAHGGQFRLPFVGGL